jgi:hypothetical protein
MKSVAELLAIAASQRQQSKTLQDTVSKLYGLKEEKGAFEIALIDPRNLFFFLGTRRSFYPESDLLHYSAWIQCLASGGQDRVDILQPLHEVLYMDGQFSVAAKLELLQAFMDVSC